MSRAIVMTMALAAGVVLGSEVHMKKLPLVERTGGMPLMEALSKRATSRNFTPGASLSDRELSEVLWAANGFNRPDRRTAPSALNAQAIDIYVCDSQGVWLYEPKAHALKPVKHEDCREATGKQPFVKDVSVNLVFVYDLDRAPNPGDDTWAKYDSAFCAQNVYLYCASKGLKTVVRGYFDAQAISKALGLRKAQKVMLAQSVGK